MEILLDAGAGIPAEAGGLPDGPVVVRILQRVAGAGRRGLDGHVAPLNVLTQTAIPGDIGRRDHCLQRGQAVDGKSLRHGVGQHRDGMIPGHTPVFIGHVAPNGQHTVGTLPPVGQHRFHQIPRQGRHQPGQEGMLGTIRIPQRENRIVRKTLRQVHVVVQSAVTAVHVHVQGRVDHRVIQGCIEHGLLVGRSVHFDEGKRLIPCSGRFGPGFLETLAGSLGLQVLQCALHAGRAQRHFHGQFRILTSGKFHPGHHLAACHFREVAILREF